MSRRSGPLALGIAFIIGGARGLGNAIAVSFAKEGSGGVAIVDIQGEETMNVGKKKVEEYGTKCLTIRADVTKEDDVERAIMEAVAELGRIDYAANFAVQDLNVSGVFFCTKHELRQMMTQTSIEVEPGRDPQLGSIVNCALVNSLQSIAGSAAYTASKHACLGVTKTAALEARSHSIRVNAIPPGFLPTAIVAGLADATSGPGEDMWTAFEARQGRTGQVEEIGDTVVLLTPRMSLVNGHNLFVDGLGGVLALQLAASYPDVLESVIVHEAPTMALLPRAEMNAEIDYCFQVQGIRVTEGAEAAMAFFAKKLVGHEGLKAVDPIVQSGSRRQDQLMFLEFEYIQSTIYCPEMLKIKEAGVRIAVASGTGSGEAAYIRTGVEQARILGCERFRVPGNHTWYSFEPEEFAGHVLKIMNSLEVGKEVEGQVAFGKFDTTCAP
ncbi:NAD(P)-binding protein [Mytilinidion resinicola]|uniref:NAD(P)-binding protein n=1 Tax=Mytilinidion resinicola TaxID=574789 RepID=A0A6A6Y9S4_9PEZI|nr:NAD(P)-binding protein [Mytilinidion resinicola]KAF2804744.1 NAD(P)-binding protein [Mytilinidion resinicola]